MSLDKATVTRIAKLARIRIDEAELKNLSADLSKILTWIDQLNSVDTDSVKPMTSVVAADLYKRLDNVDDGNYQEKILANAPESSEGFFVVPKVVE